MNEEVLKKMKKLCVAAGVFSVSFFVGTKVNEIQDKIAGVYKEYEETNESLFHSKNNNEEAMAFAVEEKKLKDQYYLYGKYLEEIYENIEEFDPEEITADEWNSLLFDFQNFDIEKVTDEKNRTIQSFDFTSLNQCMMFSETIEQNQEEEKEEEEVLAKIIPREGEISILEIDFDRIASSKKNAISEDFLNGDGINEDYWNTLSLSYEIDNEDVVTIYNGENVFGFTDIKGVKFDGEIAPIPEEEIVLASNEAEQISESEFVLDADVQIEATETNESYVWEYIDEASSLLSMQTIPEIPKIVGEDNFEIKPGYHKTYYNKTYNFTEEEKRLLGFVVEHEARGKRSKDGSEDIAMGGNYEDALGNVSIILNRLEDPRYSNDLTTILTSPGQFVVYSENAYADYVASGKQAPEYVRKAIEHATQYGIRNLDYVEWKASYIDYDRNEPNLNKRRYKMVSGGNIYHNLASSVARIELLENQISADTMEDSLNQDETMQEEAKVYSYQ